VRRDRVLVVDVVDAEDSRQSIAELANDAGYEVMHASDAYDALRKLAGTAIDGFILNIDLSGCNGIALCRAIRSIPEYETSPIVLLSNSMSRAEEAFAAGCDDLVTLPIDPLVLRARLNGHMQRSKFARLLNSTRRMLDHYVSRRTREVASRAARTGILPSPVQRDVVVVFSDIRGFTALSDAMDPRELFTMVSMELAMQVDLVHQYGGYVDKFGGDGMMAIFDGPDKVEQSCLCALKIIEGARQTAVGDGRIQQVAIGIHMGAVVIGNIGSPEHFDYSAIGAPVNLAARLCGQATALSIAVSKTIHDAAHGDPRLQFRDERQVEIRGFKERVTVYALQRSAIWDGHPDRGAI